LTAPFTRIPVDTVLVNLEAGVSEEAIIKAYPTLPKNAVAAARRWERELNLAGGSGKSDP
jgi:uncharacterized protein (DUF433 family)